MNKIKVDTFETVSSVLIDKIEQYHELGYRVEVKINKNPPSFQNEFLNQQPMYIVDVYKLEEEQWEDEQNEH